MWFLFVAATLFTTCCLFISAECRKSLCIDGRRFRSPVAQRCGDRLLINGGEQLGVKGGGFREEGDSSGSLWFLHCQAADLHWTETEALVSCWDSFASFWFAHWGEFKAFWSLFECVLFEVTHGWTLGEAVDRILFVPTEDQTKSKTWLQFKKKTSKL